MNESISIVKGCCWSELSVQGLVNVISRWYLVHFLKVIYSFWHLGITFVLNKHLEFVESNSGDAKTAIWRKPVFQRKVKIHDFSLTCTVYMTCEWFPSFEPGPNGIVFFIDLLAYLEGRGNADGCADSYDMPLLSLHLCLAPWSLLLVFGACCRFLRRDLIWVSDPKARGPRLKRDSFRGTWRLLIQQLVKCKSIPI